MPRKSPDIQDTICERIAQGESLRAICEDKGMPARQTVLAWLAKDAAFAAQYARAREEQADHYADEIVAIADEAPHTSVQDRGGEEVTVVDSAAIAHQRLRIDARKWVASKLKPKKYGEKLEVEGGLSHAHSFSSEAIMAMFGIAPSAIAAPKGDGHTPAPNKDK